MNDSDFIINVGPGGTFKPSGNFSTTPEDVDRMFARWSQQDGPLKFAIHFHGGLVNEERGLETARRMGKMISDGGAIPVCFVWETGLFETIFSNIQTIGGTQLVQGLIKMLVKKVGTRIGVDLSMGRSAGTEMSDAEIDAELSKKNAFDGFDERLATAKAQGRSVDLGTKYANTIVLEADLSTEFKRYVDANTELQNTIKETQVSVDPTPGFSARGVIGTGAFITAAVKIAVRIIKRYRDNRHHDFYPTLMEEIFRQFYLAEVGATVWGAMKQKASDMWTKNAGRTGTNQYAGRYFLDKMAALAATREVKIDLIGHSAGSIVICAMFNCAEEFPNISYRNVIFLAPACTIKRFNDCVLSRPQKFASFRMFTMYDHVERADILVPYLYTHSLLYLISGILEDGGKAFDEYILGMERFTLAPRAPYDQDDIIKASTGFLYATGMSRLICSKTAEGSTIGLRTTSTKHGNFDDDEPTLESCRHIISQ